MTNKKDIITKEIEQIEREILADKYSTALNKAKLVNELKNGLGSTIKANPNGVKLYKKSLFQRIREFLKTIFTKF